MGKCLVKLSKVLKRSHQLVQLSSHVHVILAKQKDIIGVSRSTGLIILQY